MSNARTPLLSALLGSTLLLVPAAQAQGVIEPPPEGERIAPQPPTPTAADAPAPRAPLAGAGQPRMQGPPSVADLAEGLLDAVVNISTSQSVETAGRGLPRLDAPDGSPLRELFDDLLREDGQGSRPNASLGSGFVIDPSGIVVTNNHVIADADAITVNFADGRELTAEVLGVDARTDLAVLKVEPEAALAAVEFGNSEEVRIGDWVMAIGNPFGLGGSVSVGIVSARGRNIDAGPYDNFIQTDAAINRGNSGGPLFDMYGRVIGINTAIISPTGGSIGIGFSIPSALAQNVVTQLREFGETRRGWLGVRLQSVTTEIAEGLGLPQASGALVMGIVPEGPSDTGAIEIGDVIVRFDGREIASSRDLPLIVAETPVGEEVTIDLLRKPGGDAALEALSDTVTLGRLEEDGEAAAPAAANDDVDETRSGDTLGLSLAELNATLREAYAISPDVEGVVITDVDPAAPAAAEGLEPGLSVVEIAQERVDTPQAVFKRLDELREGGQRNALMLVAEPSGDLRFVVLPLN